jgi:exonuclease III
MANIINNRTNVGERIAQLDNLPFLHLSSPISDIPQLKNSDIDLNLPFEHNFNYYCTNEFCNDYDIKQCSLDPITFSALNCNIRSLAANFDNLHNMLVELNFPFSLIGLTETKFRKDIEHVTDVDMPGYDLISQPSLSNAGGVAFYISHNLNYIIRITFTASNVDFEALWIELHFKGKQNLLCGIIYRHPNGNLDNLMNYINQTIEQIHQENKLSLVMGDFNIDLLKSHTSSENFINTMSSFFYLPHILQPTRITDHSSTLIDNIFFNSVEHFTISGNVVYDLTDHLSNFIIFHKFSSLPSSINVYKRDYSKFDEIVLLN